MFTGIVTGVGRIVARHELGSSSQFGKRLGVACPPGYLADVAVGDSIALNGACMTATSVEAEVNRFWVEVSAESLQRTCGLDREGPVNLEKALRPQDRLGGHIVSGHVDGVGRVGSFTAVGESRELRIHAPAELGRYLVFKGSVAVNGVSLTINRVTDLADGCEISINLIAHTLEHTTLGGLVPGATVNLEIDMIARYIERLLPSIAPQVATALS